MLRFVHHQLTRRDSIHHRLHCSEASHECNLRCQCPSHREVFHPAIQKNRPAFFDAVVQLLYGRCSRRHGRRQQHHQYYGSVRQSRSLVPAQDLQIPYQAQSFQIPCRQWHLSWLLPGADSCCPCLFQTGLVLRIVLVQWPGSLPSSHAHLLATVEDALVHQSPSSSCWLLCQFVLDAHLHSEPFQILGRCVQPR